MNKTLAALASMIFAAGVARAQSTNYTLVSIEGLQETINGQTSFAGQLPPVVQPFGTSALCNAALASEQAHANAYWSAYASQFAIQKPVVVVSGGCFPVGPTGSHTPAALLRIDQSPAYYTQYAIVVPIDTTADCGTYGAAIRASLAPFILPSSTSGVLVDVACVND